MNTLKHIASSLTLLLCLFASVAITGCKDDDEVAVQQYGYVQFKLYKEASRAASQLDSLRQAHKIRVVMQHDGLSIEQTLLLNASDDAAAEYGLRSDKLKLLTGEYTIIGFYLYDILDNEIMSCSVDDKKRMFIVDGGGLTMHDLYCKAAAFGQARFLLVKNMIGTRATENGAEYPFASIRTADITVRNVNTNEEKTFKKMPMSIKTSYYNAQGEKHLGQYFYIDTLITLPVGEYKVVNYITYSDKRGFNMLGADDTKTNETFTISNNRLTDSIPCPIRLNMAAEYIKDYVALKAIWEKMDGPNWKYVGEVNPNGCNWNFNKDMDQWGDQPGVSLENDGRVVSLSLVGFVAKGDVPDEIGQLTELDRFYIGAHDETVGGNVQEMLKKGTSLTNLKELRRDYATQVLDRDPLQNFSECIQTAWNEDGKHTPIKRFQRMYLYDTQGGTITNQVTGISKAIMRCTKLTQMYIANSPITYEGFFKDIKRESPFWNEKVNDTISFKWLDRLTDLEIYNCPKLTRLPMSNMIAQLPELQSVNLSQLRGISGEQLLADWNTLLESPVAGKIQLLYLGYNNLTETPSHDKMKRMEKLGLLDLTHNKLKKIAPFGKGVALVDIYLDFNELEELTPAEDGYFINCSDVETFSCSYNKLTKVPNIFNTKNVYTMQSVDFSHNNISDFDHGHGTYKGINASSVDLSNNAFERFPKELFETGSPIKSLNLAGNKIKEIKEGEMTGEKSNYLVSLDLQMNCLSKLPKDFLPENIPYFYGIDLSYNEFEHFPYTVLNCNGLTVMGIRHQHDKNGNRLLKEWPTGLYQCPSLLAFYIGGNDLRKIDDTISPNIRIFEIKDNPNISITLPASVCQYIAYGYYLLVYDPTQDIRGCDNYLDLE